jgi:hypothetical protein
MTIPRHAEYSAHDRTHAVLSRGAGAKRVRAEGEASALGRRWAVASLRAEGEPGRRHKVRPCGRRPLPVADNVGVADPARRVPAQTTGRWTAAGARHVNYDVRAELGTGQAGQAEYSLGRGRRALG